MERFSIQGGNRLVGEVTVSGAKNAAVAIIPASILCDEVCRIENIPNISDVSNMLHILKELGAKVQYVDSSTIEIDSRPIVSNVADSDLVGQMRGSMYLMGSLLGRFFHAVVAMPGGCNFGVRPIDQHLKGFSALGASCNLENGLVNISAEKLIGSNVYMDVVSVGATINIMLAAVKAEGTTVIENAAREPHVVDLANFLNSMGADIRGAGTDVVKIRGCNHLHSTTYSIIPDQIEAGTYMVAAAATSGDVLIKNVIPKHLESISAKLEEIGVEITEYDEAIRVRREGPLDKCTVKTMPHPGFPTDMHPQMAVLLTIASGKSIINESVFDNRFQYVDELRRLGAKITVEGRLAMIEGVDHLTGALVKATDLRAGVAMLIAGLSAQGVTQVEEIHYIERGYEDIINKLRSLGANIERVVVPDMPVAQVGC